MSNNEQKQAMSVREFCERNAMSRSTWFKLVREGRAPKFFKLGSATIRITLAAERDWHERMKREAASRGAVLEHARRVKHLSRLGKMAAASPNHVSKKHVAKKRAAAGARSRA